MKRIIILLGILTSITAAHIVMGQANEGVITYEVKVNMHRRLPPNRQELKSMIPEFRTSKQQLFFKDNESIYKPLIEDEDEETGAVNVNQGGMRMTFRAPSVEIYMNQEASLMLSKQEFMGKEYLINDSVKVSPWKFGTETKTILGYECKQAYFSDEPVAGQEREVTAWYTDKIKPFLGPERFNSLPGAVLAVDINNAERYMVATKVELRPLKKNDIKVPSGGQKITQAEFRKMMDEQMKQMGGNGGIIIR